MEPSPSPTSPSLDHQLEHIAPPPPVSSEPCYTLSWELPASLSSFDRLAYTWQAVASHHSVLRAVIDFPAKPPQGTFRVRILDRASNISIRSQDDTVQDLKAPRTARLTVTTNETRLRLQLRIHLVLVNRPPFARIRHDFNRFYDCLAGVPNILSTQYFENVDHRDHEKARSYWKASMSGLETSLTYGLPQSIEGRHRVFTRELDSSLVALVQRMQITLGITARDFFYALWALVQYRHTAATDNTVIFAVSGRDTSIPGSAGFVSPVKQLYPLKLILEPHLSILDWILLVAKTNQESAANAFVGYESIREQMPSVQPQVRLLLADGLDIGDEEVGTASFPFSIKLDLEAQILKMDYFSDSAETGNLEVVKNHLLTAMKAAVTDLQLTLDMVDVISEEEKNHLIRFSEPKTQPATGLVHRLFEQQVVLVPQHDAISFEGREILTYEQLNKLANRVARQLLCGRGESVPICMERSPALIISLLAVLKTGAAYIILDPDSPADRLMFIASDVEAPFVIVDRGTQAKFPKHRLIEDLLVEAAEFDASNLDVE